MMKRVFWFCPENDIALGRGCDRFTPPRRAALLARYGAPLMWWMGDEGDYVLVPEPDDAAYSREFARWEAGVTERFGQGPRFVTSLDGLDVEEPVPWGWSEYTIGQMLKAGASSSLFASVEKRVNDIRQLSHRR